MIFPIQRNTDWAGWIPESDIDGIDAKAKYLSELENADLENGFIKNALAPSEELLLQILRDLITNGYELLFMQYFYHETRKNCFIYIYWKTGTPNDLKIYLQERDNNNLILLNLDEVNNSMTVIDKPNNISFSFVENQFKLNLNCIGTYPDVTDYTKPFGRDNVILNLTIMYLDKVINYEATIQRAIGWYAFPRWTGWSLDDQKSVKIVYPTITSVAFNGSDYATNPQITISGTMSVAATDFVTNVAVGSAYLTIGVVRTLGLLIYTFASADIGQVITIRFKDTVTNTTSESTYVIDSAAEVKIQPQTLYKNPTNIRLAVDLVDVTIKTVSIYAAQLTGLAILSKNFDGQRNKLYNFQAETTAENLSLGLWDKQELWFYKNDIDYRIERFEIYIQIADVLEGIVNVSKSKPYILVNKVDPDTYLTDLETTQGGWTIATWTVANDALKKIFNTSVESTTLNFNYGLGGTVKVSNQSVIYDEILFKGRTYFVKGDTKIYQSHLSGTGRVQPDSFPYDESKEFGFFSVSKAQLNVGLSVTQLNELLILTNKKDYVYFIQGGQGIVLRQAKVINGSYSAITPQSIMKDIDGTPNAEVTLWFNEYGIFIHGGGRNSPKDISYATHRNYWKALTNKNTFFSFYNPVRKEAWIVMGAEILVYEILYNKFKKYNLGFTIKVFVGFYDNKLYMLDTNNKLQYIDYLKNTRLAAIIETHYTANSIIVGQYPIQAPEHITKILQEIYVACKDTDKILIDLQIIADGNTYSVIKMHTDVYTDLVLAPLLIRYGKVKQRLMIPPSTATIREFGYTFSVPNEAFGQFIPLKIVGLGMTSGKQAGIGL